MPVLPEIIEWSRERPLWQQDALRRLVEQPGLTTADHAALVALCKAEFGIVVDGASAALPLTNAHAGAPAAGAVPAVRLTRVHTVRHVNALCDKQTLVISPTGITVVYGDNGAGKSGYVRVLKQVCRARGAHEAVHPNVYADETPPASAVVCYDIACAGREPAPGGESAVPVTERQAAWTVGGPAPAELAQVSVFDSRSAAVYVTEENDVAYLPHGTDLFPKLVNAVEALKLTLEAEIAALDRHRDRFDGIPVGTQAFEALHNLHGAKARERFDALAMLSPADREQLDKLRAEDGRYKADNPLGRAKELRHCAARLAAARQRLVALEAALDHFAIGKLREACEAVATARAATELASGGAFTEAPIGGLRSDAWRALWQAARHFAEAGAVPAQAFPPSTQADAVCLLCQQELGVSARERLQRFDDFVRGETRVMVDRAMRELEERVATLATLSPHTVADEALIEEIRSLDEELAVILVDCSAAFTRRRDEAVDAARAAEAPSDWAPFVYEPRGGSERLAVLEARMAAEAAQYEAAVNPDARKAAEIALRELESRAALEGLRERAYAEIDRQALKAKLTKCVKSANTTAITRRNTELLREVVSQPLADEFARQIAALDLTHLPITVHESHGQKGKAFHALALGKKARAKVPTDEVLSEGEHRCTALAAFFAEVSLQDSASTVVFDDPVSSLDHGRRKYVAQRLVDIATTRPVLVFTHDLVFLWMLQGAAEKRAVELAPRYFRRDESGAGLITDDWPWDGQNVKTRLGTLKTTVAAFPKLAGTDPRRYEVEVRQFYGKLRETWERAVEEVLFNGAIRRFSKEVQTLRLRNLHRITEQQMQDFEAGMTKASAWIQGHDHATELALPVPEPDEVTADLSALERWVNEMRKQHDAKSS